MGRNKRPATNNTPYGQSYTKRTKSNNLLALSKHIKSHTNKLTHNKLQQDNVIKLKQQHDRSHKLSHAVVPYTTCQNILLVGEANYSFTHSLLSTRRMKHGKPNEVCKSCVQYHMNVDNNTYKCGYNITATSYDSYNTLQSKYNDVQQHIDECINSDVTVLHDVDCTMLHKYKFYKSSSTNKTNTDTDNNSTTQPTTTSNTIESYIQQLQCNINELKSIVYNTKYYDRVLFLFPHLGSGEQDTIKNNQQHQLLLYSFLLSVSQSVHLLKPMTQNGEIHIVIKSGEPYTSWNVNKLNKNISNIKYIGTAPFYPHLYPQYQHMKTNSSHQTTSNQNQANEFLSNGCITYRFGITESAQDRRDMRRYNNSCEQLNELYEKLQLYESMKQQGVQITIDNNVQSNDEWSEHDISTDYDE